jgi:hypothetical protein
MKCRKHTASHTYAEEDFLYAAFRIPSDLFIPVLQIRNEKFTARRNT